MGRKCLNWVLMLVLLLFTALYVRAASDDANIYFNAGTEKYLQGNFTESIDNLEKAQALDPGNTKIKEFMVKILLEAGTQNHMTRNYRQAFIYLDKAHKLDPENAKVTEMYTLTKSLLNPSAEKVAPKEAVGTPVQKSIEKKRTDSILMEEAAAARQQLRAAAVQQNAQKVRTQADEFAQKVQQGGKGAVMFDLARLKEWHIWSFIYLLLGTSLATIILFIMWLFSSRELNNYKRQFSGMEQDMKNAVENANTYKVELEKAKESVKYEHQIREKLQKELTEIVNKDEQHMKTVLDLKTKDMEEKVRAEIAVKMRSAGGQKEHFINHQQERFMKYVSDTSAPEETESDPVLASARERIALMAQNLYEYAPGAAVDFIKKMVKSENPSIRTNIVQALANIARVETLEMLFDLYNDSDQRVKREVLRNLKSLNQKIATGALSLDAAIAAKVKLLINEEKDRGEWIF